MTLYQQPISAIEREYLQSDDAHAALLEHQRLEGFVCVIAGRTRDPATRIITHTTLQCRQSGSFRAWSNKQNKYSTSSYKSGCNFRARIRYNKRQNIYTLKILEPSHNHDRLQSLASSSTLRQQTQKQFGIDRLLALVEAKSKRNPNGYKLTAKEIAAQIQEEHAEVMIIGLDVFHLQKKLRLGAHRAGTSTQALTSEDEAPATGDYEPDPDVVRLETPESSEPTASSVRIPSAEEEDVNATVPRAREVEVQQKGTSKATSSRRKRGSQQEASETQTQAQFKEIQLAIAKLTGAVEALQATQYAMQAALIAQQPPSFQHQANHAMQQHAFPMAAWPAQQPEHPQTNTQSLSMGRLSQFSSGYQPGPYPLASHSSQHMTSSSDAGLQYSAAPRPH